MAFGILWPKNKLIIIAIRGALPVRFKRGWCHEVNLNIQKVDYKHMRCSIGLWNPQTQKLFFAPGSTVPYYDEVLKATDKGGKGANQLEPGYYTDLFKGEHLMGKLKGHQALRQTAYRFVRRAAHPPPYVKSDPLFFSNPYDNLHCSWNAQITNPGYASAGCLVVSGQPFCKRMPKPLTQSGPWKHFHNKVYAIKQKKFPLLLVEANTIRKLNHTPHSPTYLCYGSQGAPVKKLQNLLKRLGLYLGPINGNLDAKTYKAWNLSGFQQD